MTLMTLPADSPFPDHFVFGASTSSYQIEGAVGEDGRGESIWDRFTTAKGNVADSTDGSVACDHYRRYPEDVALMAEIGLDAYRFSIAWPRILPTGRVHIEPRGLAFYDRLVDLLLEYNITPYVTLYHWDLPQALEDEGGWPVRTTAQAFVDYTDVVTRVLGDRVKHWITQNEPWCVSVLGHEQGKHAPGRKDTKAALAAAHHLLLAHGWAVPVIRQNVAQAKVGAAPNLVPATPASPSDADRLACQHFDGWFNRWYMDPLYGRGYPADIVAHHVATGSLPEGPLPFVQDGDMDAIAAPTDFIGVNYYSRGIVRSNEVGEHENLPRTVPEPDPKLATDMGWEVYPDGLYDVVAWVHENYRPGSILITENGCAYADGPGLDGRVHDTRRIDYFHGHLLAAQRAIADGMPLDGIFVWSFMDNFEWAEGYEKRFGMVHVNYDTLERTVKESGRFFQRVIAERRVVTP